MLKIAAFLLVLTAASNSAWSADDPWQKAKQLAIGSDIRIYKLGSTEPISGKMAGVGEGKVQVIVKKDQIAIRQSDIDHIDYRPPRGKSKTESNVTSTDGFGTTTTSSSGTSWSREGWQTVYRKNP